MDDGCSWMFNISSPPKYKKICFVFPRPQPQKKISVDFEKPKSHGSLRVLSPMPPSPEENNSFVQGLGSSSLSLNALIRPAILCVEVALFY